MKLVSIRVDGRLQSSRQRPGARRRDSQHLRAFAHNASGSVAPFAVPVFDRKSVGKFFYDNTSHETGPFGIGYRRTACNIAAEKQLGNNHRPFVFQQAVRRRGMGGSACQHGSPHRDCNTQRLLHECRRINEFPGGRCARVPVLASRRWERVNGEHHATDPIRAAVFVFAR